MKISMEHIHNMYRQNEAQSVKKDENEYGINRKRNFDEIKISAQTEMIPGETEESLHRWLSLKLPEPSASLSL